MTRTLLPLGFPAFLLFTSAVLLLMLSTCSEAFLQQKNSRQCMSSSASSFSSSLPRSPAVAQIGTRSSTTTELYNLFGNLFGQQQQQQQQQQQESNEQSDNGSGNNSQQTNNNPTVDVIDIPAKVIKIKPLKFYLQLFLVSQQNTPFQGAWLLNANEEVEEYLEVYFSDGTGMISVQFDDLYGLKIKRKGQRPSLQYMLQESVLLHALLDELEAIAFGKGDEEDDDVVDDSKRLLQFAEGNRDVLTKAREVLPARAA